MRRISMCCLVLLVATAQVARAQYQQGPGGYGGAGGPGSITGSGRGGPQDDIPSTPIQVKPDKAAAKAYAGGIKSLGKARELEDALAKATDPDKKAALTDKLGDMYGRALDQFTEVIRNKSDMYDAWNQVGFVHLRLGAYRESIDDYNHTLALKPDLAEAIQHRAEAYMYVDRLEEAKAAYMDLFYHDRSHADQLMASMQVWLAARRADANGMRASDIDKFGQWLQDRDSVAKTTASTTP